MSLAAATDQDEERSHLKKDGNFQEDAPVFLFFFFLLWDPCPVASCHTAVRGLITSRRQESHLHNGDTEAVNDSLEAAATSPASPRSDYRGTHCLWESANGSFCALLGPVVAE